jgi:hypothetical protein
MNRRRSGGQATLEVVGAIPIVVVAMLVVWQLAAFVRGAMLVRDDARTKALGAAGAGVVTVVAERRVGSVIPGIGPFRIRVHATTVAP